MGRRGLVLLLAAILTGCVGAGSETTPSADPGGSAPASLERSTPPASASASPDLTPSTSPSIPAAVEVDPAPLGWLAWHSLGTIPSADIRGVVGFAKGYVAFASSGPARLVYYSPDGRTWRPVTLPFNTTKAAFSPGIWAVTTDGTHLLAVGGYAHTPCIPALMPSTGSDTTGGGPPCPLAPISWISADGITWKIGFPGPLPADPPGYMPGYTQGSEFVAAWPVPTGGWDAALSHWNGEFLGGQGLMHSVDGLRWTRLATPPAADVATDFPPFAHAGVADAGGLRVVWQDWDERAPADSPTGNGRFVATVATYLDGRTWTDVGGFPGDNAHVLLGVAPGDGGSRWVLAGSSGPASGTEATTPTLWTSVDARTWTLMALPIASGVRDVTGLVHGAPGYVAVSGYRGMGDMWGSGEATSHETWLSADGFTWTELPVSGPAGADYGPGLVADGPAGVIGISLSPTDPDHASTVWQLR
jgi:hypothetical protein